MKKNIIVNTNNKHLSKRSDNVNNNMSNTNNNNSLKPEVQLPYLNHNNNNNNNSSAMKINSTDNYSTERDIIMTKVLKSQNTDLNEQLQKALVNASESEFNCRRAEDKLNSVCQELESKENEIKNLNEAYNESKSTIINLNEALLLAKKEILRYKTLYENESKRLSQTKQDFKEQKEKDIRYVEELNASIYSSKNIIENLNFEIAKLKEEIEAIKYNMIPNNKVNNLVEQNNKVVIDLQRRIEKLLLENRIIKEKLAQKDHVVNSQTKVIKSKNEKISDLKAEHENLKLLIEKFTGDLKWNLDLNQQKDNQIKSIKNKFDKLEQELREASQAYSKLKERINIDVEKSEN